MADPHQGAEKIFTAQPADLERLLEFVRTVPETPHWPAEAWQSFFDRNEPGTHVSKRLFGMQRSEGKLVGLAAAALAGSESELELLLVSPATRRQGIGRQLTEHWLRWAREGGAEHAFLEVRASNNGAQALYRSLAFHQGGVRTGYYRNPVEDAVWMRRDLP